MIITDLFVPFPDELQIAATSRVPAPPRVEWTSAWGDLFFRVKGADPQIVWCVLGRGARAKRPLSRARLATLNKYVSAAYAGRTFFRVVPFSDGDDWALVRPKRALVKSPTQPTGAVWHWSADFPAPQGQIEWLSQPLRWFESWLAETADANLQKARAVATLNVAERSWFPLCRVPQVRAHWECLLPALQKLSYDIFEESSKGEPLRWNMGWIAEAREHRLPPYWRYDWSSTSPSGLSELLSLLNQYFPLELQLASWNEIGVRGGKSPHIPPEFTTNLTTQHEKLEAALLWRNFGREIGEGERVEAALSQLLGDYAQASG